MPNYQTQIPASRVPLVDTDALPTREWYRYFSDLFNFTGIATGAKTIGSFFGTATQTAAANTPTPVALNTTSIATSIVLNTPQIVMQKTAPHQFYATVSFTSTIADTAIVYLQVNGTTVANSGRSVPVPSTGIDGAAVITLNIAYQFTAGDIAELIWVSVGGHAQIHSVTSPSIPGVTVTVTQLD